MISNSTQHFFHFRRFQYLVHTNFRFKHHFLKKMLQQKKQLKKSFLIHLILNFCFEKTKKFRTNYVKTRKILQIIEKTFTKTQRNSMLNLSFKLNIFKRQIKRHIFLLKMFRKIITIIIEKQSSFAIRKKKFVDKKLNDYFDIIDSIS